MTLPQIQLGDRWVSRLILGNNPISGYSHYTPEFSSDMEEYFTMANAKLLLRRCEEAGINAFQGRADRWILHLMKEHWNDGGRMSFICQTAGEMKDIRANIKLAANSGAYAIYHHGTETDNYWREGRIEELRDVMKTARDSGVVVGVGSHTPEVIEYIEEKDWDIDFYMTSFYNVYKDIKGRKESYIVTGIHIKDRFESEDRDRICRTIQSVKKTCLAFKILASSRHCQSHETVREAFRFAFEHIKPIDAVVVGMFPRYNEQVEENAALVKEFG